MRLCVLIPAFNEAKVIRRSILSAYGAGLDAQDVYVVDDGSKDNTAEVARYYKAQVLSKPNGGKAAALRSGIDHFDLTSRYTHVMVLDADSIVDPDYAKAMERATVRHPNAVLFCGRQCSQRGPWNWLTAYRSVDYAVWCGVYREAQHATGTVNVAPGFASMYRMDTFASLDFDGGTVVEDMDMTMQLQRRREEIVYVPDALVATQDPLKLKDFIGQMMRWYRGTWQVVKKHRLGGMCEPVDLKIGALVLGQLLIGLLIATLPLWYGSDPQVVRYSLWAGGAILMGATCRTARKRGLMSQRVDAEFTWLVGEQMLVGALIATLPLWLYYYPQRVLLALVIDQALVLTYTILTAIRERRIELIVLYPTFVIPRLLGYFLFAWAYLLERRTVETKWYSVERYS